MIKASAVCRRPEGDVQGASVCLGVPYLWERLIAPQSPQGSRSALVKHWRTYGVFAAFVRGHVTSRPVVLAWMRCAFARAFVALGARLALAERQGVLLNR